MIRLEVIASFVSYCIIGVINMYLYWLVSNNRFKTIISKWC